MKAETGRNGGFLAGVVASNEQARAISRISGKISLVALNAMLAARRGGAPGFRTVAGQLRELSERLDGEMGLMAGQVALAVYDSAARMKRSRRVALMAAANGEERLEKVLERNRRVLSESARESEARRLRLLERIRSASRLGDFGIALARNARIEAVHGGEMATALYQVGLDIEQSMQDILDSLARIESEIGNWS